MKTMMRRCLLLLAALSPAAAHAEIHTLRISKEFGISYAPMAIMERLHLVEAHAKALGVPNLKVSWLQLTGGAPTNDALISGNLDIATGGVGPMLTIWSRTLTNFRVRGLAALNSMPLDLNTIDPAVKTIRDFTATSRIGLPAVRISIQAVTLEMAAAQAFGQAHYNKLDGLTVSMGHPDAMSAMLSGHSEITAHFGSPPFQEVELQNPKVHRVLNSYDVLGGPATFNVAWATSRFVQQNPRVVQAFMAALEEAEALIKSNPKRAAQIWISVEKSHLPQDLVLKIMTNPDYVFTTTPQNVMKYATFMAKVGTIKETPASWKDLFFDTMRGRHGS